MMTVIALVLFAVVMLLLVLSYAPMSSKNPTHNPNPVPTVFPMPQSQLPQFACQQVPYVPDYGARNPSLLIFMLICLLLGIFLVAADTWVESGKNIDKREVQKPEKKLPQSDRSIHDTTKTSQQKTKEASSSVDDRGPSPIIDTSLDYKPDLIPENPSTPDPEDEPPTDSIYTVQVGAFNDLSIAHEQASHLRQIPQLTGHTIHIGYKNGAAIPLKLLIEASSEQDAKQLRRRILSKFPKAFSVKISSGDVIKTYEFVQA